MTGPITVRRVVTVVALTAAWCGLWGSVTVANVASGLVVSVAVLATGFGTSGQGGIRWIPLLRLGWLVLVDLTRSTVDVAYEILTPTDHTEEGIIAIELPGASRHHHLLLTVAITLTPGTAVVDVDSDTGTVYLHLLHIDQRESVEAHTRRLANLACEALPVTDRAEVAA